MLNNSLNGVFNQSIPPAASVIAATFSKSQGAAYSAKPSYTFSNQMNKLDAQLTGPEKVSVLLPVALFHVSLDEVTDAGVGTSRCGSGAPGCGPGSVTIGCGSGAPGILCVFRLFQ